MSVRDEDTHGLSFETIGTMAKSMIGSGDMVQQSKELFRTHAQQMTVRPLSEFLNLRKLAAPSGDTLAKRMQANLLQFQGNYLIVFLIVSAFVCIWNPLFLFGMLIVGALWAYVFVLRKEPFLVAGTELTSVHKTVPLVLLTFFFFWLFNLGAWTFFILAVAGSAIGGHAACYVSENESNSMV